MTIKTVAADTIISGTTFQSINAQAAVIQVKSSELNSSAVIITGEPNVKLFMVE